MMLEKRSAAAAAASAAKVESHGTERISVLRLELGDAAEKNVAAAAEVSTGKGKGEDVEWWRMRREMRRALAAAVSESVAATTGESIAAESAAWRLIGWLVVATKVLLQPVEGGGDGEFNDGGEGGGIGGVESKMRRRIDESARSKGDGPLGL